MSHHMGVYLNTVGENEWLCCQGKAFGSATYHTWRRHSGRHIYAETSKQMKISLSRIFHERLSVPLTRLQAYKQGCIIHTILMMGYIIKLNQLISLPLM